MLKRLLFPILTALAIVATTACGNDARNGNTPNSTAANRPAADQRAENETPITLTGCLQQDGRTYIVTRLNEPSRKGVGTTGNGAAVEREQLRQAANAYRIESKDQSDWDRMVGKQVRVSGSVRKTADLPAATTGSGSAGSTPGGSNDTSREKIDKGDLAQVTVESMTIVSDACGGK
jgi:hypothetical protein